MIRPGSSLSSEPPHGRVPASEERRVSWPSSRRSISTRWTRCWQAHGERRHKPSRGDNSMTRFSIHFLRRYAKKSSTGKELPSFTASIRVDTRLTILNAFVGGSEHTGVSQRLGARMAIVWDGCVSIRTRPSRKRSRARASSPSIATPMTLLGLMCRPGRRTRRSHAPGSSALSVHNEILKSRPDLLAALYRGFPYATDVTGAAVTAVNIPVFSSVRGKVSCMYLPRHMRRAAELMSVQIPADLEEAIQYLDRVAMSEDLAIEFSLEQVKCSSCTISPTSTPVPNLRTATSSAVTS